MLKKESSDARQSRLRKKSRDLLLFSRPASAQVDEPVKDLGGSIEIS